MRLVFLSGAKVISFHLIAQLLLKIFFKKNRNGLELLFSPEQGSFCVVEAALEERRLLYLCAVQTKRFMKAIYTIGLLVLSNIFMTFAWYGHLKFQHLPFFQKAGILGAILASWLIAFFEYCLMVPANRMGFDANGGPFSLVQLKVMQEVITLLVFSVFTLVFFKSEPLKWNHLVGFILLIGAVYFIRK